MARETSVIKESGLALSVRVIARQRSAKLLLSRPIELRNPVRIGIDERLDLCIEHAAGAQFGAHPIRSVAARRMGCHQILQVAAVVDQSLCAQPLDQRPDHGRVVALLEQLAAQFLRSVIAPRQRIERRDPGCARIQGLYVAAAQRCYASLASLPRFMVAFSGISLARTCPSMSFATSGCCCKKVRALSLPWPMRSPL